MYWDGEEILELKSKIDKNNLWFEGHPIIVKIGDEYHFSKHTRNAETVNSYDFYLDIPNYNIISIKHVIKQAVLYRKPRRVRYILGWSLPEILEEKDLEDIGFVFYQISNPHKKYNERDIYTILIYRGFELLYTVENTTGLVEHSRIDLDDFQFRRRTTNEFEGRQLWEIKLGVETLVETKPQVKFLDWIKDNNRNDLLTDYFLNKNSHLDIDSLLYDDDYQTVWWKCENCGREIGTRLTDIINPRYPCECQRAKPIPFGKRLKIAEKTLRPLVNNLVKAINGEMKLPKEHITPKSLEISLNCTFDKNFFYCLYQLRNDQIIGRDISSTGVVKLVFKTTNINPERLARIHYCLNNSDESDFEEYIKETHPYYVLDKKYNEVMRSIYYYSDYPKKVENTIIEEIIPLFKQWKNLINKEKTKIKPSVKWVNEYRLFYIINIIFPNAVHQKRFEWLSPQSLDIYIPELALAIEYQGEQHYQSIDFFGGEQQLMTQQKLDERKKKLCGDNFIKLLEWDNIRWITIDNLLRLFEKNSIEGVPSKEECIMRIRNYNSNNEITYWLETLAK